jgi:hypothetical protein
MSESFSGLITDNGDIPGGPFIYGLTVKLPSAKLKELFLARVDYHLNQVALCEKIRRTAAYGDDSAFDTMVEMDEQARKHKEYANYFRVMVDTIVPNSQYVIDHGDLRRLMVSNEV